ncbi:MAG: TolC family protein [Planctomycetes bacterium]|nr:TolC family protein [Planctomycetota bacterium]
MKIPVQKSFETTSISRRMIVVGFTLLGGLLPSCAHYRRTGSVQLSAAAREDAVGIVHSASNAAAAVSVKATEGTTHSKPQIQQANHQTATRNATRNAVADNPLLVAAKKPAATVLTLDAVERLAIQSNPTLALAEANIGAADGRWMQAGLYPNPKVGYQGNEIGNNGRGGQQGVFISQEIVTANKLGLSQHTAAHELGRRQAQRSAQRFRVLTSVRVAFYDALVAQETVKIAKELLEVSQQGLETTETQKKAQKVSDVDVLQAKVELNEALILLRKANNRKRAAWKQLRALIGQPDLAETSLQGDWEPASAQLDAETALQKILSESPEITAAQQDVSRAYAAWQRAIAQPTPNVTVQGGLQYDFDTNHSIVNLQMSLPIPVRNANQGNIHAAESEWIAASRELERRKLAIRNRFAAAYERYANANYEVERYKSDIIPNAAESLRLIKEVFEKGEASYLRLLTAQRSNSEAQVRYRIASRAWWTAKLEIDGLLLMGGLKNPGD